jgi:cytochrome c oxidase subunit III
MSGVATATAVETGHAHPSVNRPNLTSVGTIIWLSSELMFFAALFAMYFTLRSVMGSEYWAEQTDRLNVPYALTITVILVLSSATCQLGVFAAERGDVFGLRRWYIITLIMGTIFVLGQSYEYFLLIGDGVTMPSGAYGTVFFMTTGFHGLHVIGGLVAFVYLLMRTRMSKFTPQQATSAIVVSYYWHFVDAVWIALFAMIFFLPAPVVT